MNVFGSTVSCLHRIGSISYRAILMQQLGSPVPQQRAASTCLPFLAPSRRQALRCGTLGSHAEGVGVYQHLPWHHQQVRTRKRGTEYQPSNIKRKRTHGWIKRISTQSGVEVILRRMLKGRKSLTH